MHRSKEQVGKLMRELGNVFTTADAATVIDISNSEASKMLSRWVLQGWLTRVRRGLYAIVPLDAMNNQQILEDAWVLVPDLFSHSYIGGWSATEYWDFTEQLFRDVCIFTEQTVLHKKTVIHNIAFFLTHISHKHNFGTKVIWKENKKIMISDPHKTIMDGMYNPSSCGGIQHLVDCFKMYVKSDHHSPKQLAAYALRMGNGAVFKRLGFLYSKITKAESELTELCQKKLTKGVAYLDPSIKIGSIITRWRLKVPEQLQI